MKEIIKTTLKLLFGTVLVGIMLLSAQHCMNLPFGWESLEYFAIFDVALALWGCITGTGNCRIGLINISIKI